MATSIRSHWFPQAAVLPFDVVEHRRIFWQDVWCRQPDVLPVAYEALKRVRQEVSEDDDVVRPLTSGAVIDALYTRSDKTATGADITWP